MEGAQQRKRIQRDEALPIVSNNPTFMCWEQLVDGATIKYGSRTYTKGRRGQEEMLMGHIKRTHESNAKRPQKGQGVLAAATEEGGKRGTKRRAAALSEALSPAAVVVKGQKIGKSGNNPHPLILQDLSNDKRDAEEDDNGDDSGGNYDATVMAMPPPSARGQNCDDFDNNKNEVEKDDNNDNDDGGGAGDDGNDNEWGNGDAYDVGDEHDNIAGEFAEDLNSDQSLPKGVSIRVSPGKQLPDALIHSMSSSVLSAANPPDMERETREMAMKLMRPLMPEEQMVVVNATQGKGPLSEILAKHDADFVQCKSMQTLCRGKWLADEVINYFLKNCLSIRDKKMCERDTGRRRSHFFNTFFFQHMFNEKNNDLNLRGI